MTEHEHYLAVVAGENRFGWRLAVPIWFLEFQRHCSILLLGAEVIHGRSNDLPSIIVTLEDFRRDYLIICQYSLISPHITSTIAHIRFDSDNWDFVSVCSMGVDHLAVVFNNLHDYRYRFKVFNVTTSSLVRTFDIVLEIDADDLIAFNTTNGHQPILRAYSICSSRIHRISDYEVPNQVDGSFIPVVHRKPSKSLSLYWDMLTDHQMDVYRSLNLLNPVRGYHSIMRSLVILGHQMGSGLGIIVYPSRHGILRRWIKVPSLKFLAAEALFRARPTLDRWQLEKMVGFDIFHGMSTKRDEDIEPVDVEETIEEASRMKACCRCMIL